MSPLTAMHAPAVSARPGGGSGAAGASSASAVPFGVALAAAHGAADRPGSGQQHATAPRAGGDRSTRPPADAAAGATGDPAAPAAGDPGAPAAGGPSERSAGAATVVDPALLGALSAAVAPVPVPPVPTVGVAPTAGDGSAPGTDPAAAGQPPTDQVATAAGAAPVVPAAAAAVGSVPTPPVAGPVAPTSALPVAGPSTEQGPSAAPRQSGGPGTTDAPARPAPADATPTGAPSAGSPGAGGVPVHPGVPSQGGPAGGTATGDTTTTTAATSAATGTAAAPATTAPVRSAEPDTAPAASPTPTPAAAAVRADAATSAGTGHETDRRPTDQGGQGLPSVAPTRGGDAPFVVPAGAASAPTAGAATANAPAPLAQQLARPVFSLAHAGPGEHVVTVQVTPDALGPVTVRAHVTAHGMHVKLFAASDAGRDAVRQELPDLRRDSAGSGVTTTLDLSSQNHPGAQPGRDDRPTRGATRSETAQEARPAPTVPVSTRPTTVRSVGLDVLA